MQRLLMHHAACSRRRTATAVFRLFSQGTRPAAGASESNGTAQPVEVSGRVVATDDRLLMIKPDYYMVSTRTFRPGSIVRLANGDTACLAFEAAGFSFALLLPCDAAAAAELSADLVGRPSPLTGEECYISTRSLTFSFSARTVAGGSVLDCFGHPLAGAASAKADNEEEEAAVEAKGETIVQVAFNPAPGQFDRQVIRDNVHTGVTAIDSLTPFGRGQSMLVFGEAGTGKSTIAADIIRAQHEFSTNGGKSPIRCVYAATSVDNAQLDGVVRDVLGPAGTDVTVVASSSEDGDVGALFAVLSACSLGEHHRDSGGHSLVVLDDLSGLQRLWDKGWGMAHAHLKQGAKTPPVEIGQLRSWYMPLLQRAAKLSDDKRGGGSMSVIAMVDTPPSPADHLEVGREQAAGAGAAGASAGAGAGAGPAGENKTAAAAAEADPALTPAELQQLGLSPLDMQRLNTLVDRGVVVTHRMLQKLGIRSQRQSGQRALAHAAAAAHPYYAAFQVRSPARVTA